MNRKDNKENLNNFYTVKEVSELIGISESEIIRLIFLRKLKALRIGKSLRINEKDLESFLDSLVGKQYNNFESEIEGLKQARKDKVLYTAEQVAKILNLSVDNVWLLLKTKKLKGFKIRDGRSSWRIPEEKLDEFIEYRMKSELK